MRGRGRSGSLRLAVAQPESRLGDVATNALAHAVAVRAADARVVVFPELSLSGYELGAPPVDPGDARLGPIIEACAATASVALVGAIVSGAGGRDVRHIGMLAIDATGGRVVYRKLHLGGAEPRSLVAGDAPAVLVVDGWRLGLAICRDTGVPEHAERTCALGIDAYVAGMVEAAEHRAVPGARARRIATTHGVWVAIASHAGPTGGGYAETAGGSGIWRPDGTEAGRAGESPGEIVTAELA